MVTRLSAAPAAAALVLLGIAIGAGGGASANPGAGASANQTVAGDSVTIGGLTAKPSLEFGCPLPGGPLIQCSSPPSGGRRAPGHLPLAPRGLLVIRTPRPPDPRGPRPQVSSITVALGFAPRRATGVLKRIVVLGSARPNSEHTRWTFRLPRHIAGNELDLALDDRAVEGFGVTTDPSCA
jgi:hypothetical protein